MSKDHRITRRQAVIGVAASASLVGTKAGQAAIPMAPRLTATNSSVLPPTSKYIFQHPLLFQRAHVRSVPFSYVNSAGTTVSVPGNDVSFESGNWGCGSNHTMLCIKSRRPWKNAGGDWVDSAGVPQGSTPFSTSATLANGTGAGTLNVDVTSAMQFIWTRQRWCALFLKVGAGGGNIKLDGVRKAGGSPPRLSVTFSDGTVSYDTWYVASVRASTVYTNSQDDSISCDGSTPGLLEFYQASAPNTRISTNGRTVVSATLAVPHSSVTGGSVNLNVYVVNPWVPASLSPTAGIAAAYPLDAGLIAHPAVAAALRVTDSTAESDVLDIDRMGTGASDLWSPSGNVYGYRSEAVMDPYLWTPTPGTGDFAGVAVPTTAQRNALFPRRSHTATNSKLSGFATKRTATTLAPIQQSVRVITSTDSTALARGFTPLAPGLGALEFLYGGGNVLNGQSTLQGSTGSTGIDLDLWFKEAHIGQVIDGYMRMYVLLGDGWDADDRAMRHQFYAPSGVESDIGKYPEQLGVSPTATSWRELDRAGKFPGGIQQATSGHTKVSEFTDPTRAGGTATTVRTEGGAYSNSSGAWGYQGRWMFIQGYYKQGHPGPAVGGLALGMEFYDFGGGAGPNSYSTIPSQNFIGANWDASWESFASHEGVGFIYPRKWYCVEMRWHMNTIKPFVTPPVGTHYMEGGHNVDGYLEWWVDGIHAAKTPLWAHRSSAAIIDWALQNAQGVPFDGVVGSPDRLRGMTNVPPALFMGASSAIFNAYYGGRTFNDSNKFVYLNGIVVSNGQYIGPMAGVSRQNGGLG